MCKKKCCEVVKYAGSAVLRSVVNTLKNSSFRWTWPKSLVWDHKKNEDEKREKNREYCSQMHVNISKNIKWNYLRKKPNMEMQHFTKELRWFEEQWAQHELVTWQC